ncbi:ABC-type transport system involved in multi-copper enzyme maturation permease subunit [Kibdelosporangium banguiense]|uniref:ABC-type transport system involved in multi-copper enzyme maturation permease subunit n=1 Tax=Kibdelosporangium banguiense TaxID=1365924 RepID=A0ABS4TWL5_9PSEU|nr:DUF998 domain-containing protein [Kibdelosporangium banguiense]MBP2328776.1 ABC-type transport system involved in multi-copper enzyme maturation permease subunit [Kibdelosporangium banguiense]
MSTVIDRTLESLRHGVLREGGRTALLVCGVLSSLLYAGTTILATLLWEGYNTASQTISELFAIDAPPRALVVALFLAHNILLIAFAAGVWASANRRALRVTAGLLAGIGVIGSVATVFFSIHLRGAVPTTTDTMHAVLTGVIVALILLAVGFAATTAGMWFRVYSWATLATLVVFGAMAGLQGPHLAANESTPWLGVLERINIGGYLLWLTVLAVVLLRAQVRRSATAL